MSQKPGRHYLAQFYGANDNPRALFRKCNIVARAIYPSSGVKSFSSLQVRVVGIHENGAVIQSSAIGYLPDHFYICLGEQEIFLTCAKSNMVDTDMVVSFAQEEDSKFVEALIQLPFPLSPLKRMSGICAPAIEARIRRTRRYA